MNGCPWLLNLLYYCVEFLLLCMNHEIDLACLGSDGKHFVMLLYACSRANIHLIMGNIVNMVGIGIGILSYLVVDILSATLIVPQVVLCSNNITVLCIVLSATSLGSTLKLLRLPLMGGLSMGCPPHVHTLPKFVCFLLLILGGAVSGYLVIFLD